MVATPAAPSHLTARQRTRRTARGGASRSVPAPLLAPALVAVAFLVLPLAGPGNAVRVVVRPKEVRYYVVWGGELLEVQHHDDYVDRGVYLLLAELAGRA